MCRTALNKKVVELDNVTLYLKMACVGTIIQEKVHHLLIIGQNTEVDWRILSKKSGCGAQIALAANMRMTINHNPEIITSLNLFALCISKFPTPHASPPLHLQHADP